MYTLCLGVWLRGGKEERNPGLKHEGLLKALIAPGSLTKSFLPQGAEQACCGASLPVQEPDSFTNAAVSGHAWEGAEEWVHVDLQGRNIVSGILGRLCRTSHSICCAADDQYDHSRLGLARLRKTILHS